jgi:lysophospholipase
MAPAFGPWGRVLKPMTADGVTLHARLAEVAGARGHVVLLTGRTEFTEKYAEVAREFMDRGFSVVSLDWRGQGASPRLTDEPMLGHVEDFAEYRADLEALLALPAVGMLPGPRVVLAHSIGGAIALRWLADQPGAARALILSAPMLGLTFPLGLGLVAPPMARAAVALGLGRRFAIGGGPASYLEQGFEGNVLTSDEAAFAALADFARENPHAALGGPSWRWVREAYRVMEGLPTTPPVPTLALLGADEALVSAKAIRSLAGKPGGALVELPGARHEPLIETEATRAAVWRAIDGFLADQLG